MIKVLWWSDFMCATGFGNVAEEIVTRLHATGKYEFTIVAINHLGEPYNVPTSPYYKFKDIPIFASVGDIHNVYRFKEQLIKADYDVIFVQQDPYNMVPHMEAILRAKLAKQAKYILYSPIDSDDLHPCWVDLGFKAADYPVVYTKYGARIVKSHDPGLAVRTAYIGVDTEVYSPLTAKERTASRRKLFDAGPKDFLMLNISTNQRRKDLPRSIFTWREVRKRIPSAKLVIHTNQKNEVQNGYHLEGVIEMHVPENLRDRIIFPRGEFPKSRMREVIGACDVLISTSQGEGWGMPITEAMACKVPVVVPRHTSFEEIVGRAGTRGYLAETENYFMLQHDLERCRPIASLDSLVRAVRFVHDDKKGTRRRVNAAYRWVKENCDWDKICVWWDKLFTEAYKKSGSGRTRARGKKK